MAKQLKRENDIITLKVELKQGDRVSCVLQVLDGGKLRGILVWEGLVCDFGLPGPDSPARRSLDYGWAGNPEAYGSLNDACFVLPIALKDELRRHVPRKCRCDRALWIHLVKPYGALRFVPWERLLPEVVDLPVLMLPDFVFPPPRMSASGLNIALCASAPLNCQVDHVFEALQTSIRAILDGLSEEAPALHVFADVDIALRLRSDGSLPDRVKVYEPASAEPYITESLSSSQLGRGVSLRSPWLLWMRDELRSNSTDVVHFVCHGNRSAQSGSMLFGQSPLDRDEHYPAGPVGCTELSNFITQVGAWSTVFSSPMDNQSVWGLRALADEVAQSLPGPMMMYDGRYGKASDLAEGFRFIHSQTQQSPPNSRSLYLYCQPYLLFAHRGRSSKKGSAASIRLLAEHYARNELQRNSILLETPAGKSVSAVSAATERFAEKVQLRYQQLMRDELVPDEIVQRDLQASMEMIDLIRHSVNLVELQRLKNDIELRLGQMELDLESIRQNKLGRAFSRHTIFENIESPLKFQKVRFKELDQIEELVAQLQGLESEAVSLMKVITGDVVTFDASALDSRMQRVKNDLEQLEPSQLLQGGQKAEN